MERPPAPPHPFWNGLTKLLHLHTAPSPGKEAASFLRPPISTISPPRPVRGPSIPIPTIPPRQRSLLPQGYVSSPQTPPPSPLPTRTRSPNPSSMPRQEEDPFIVTDYDKILELVKSRRAIKLDEIARLLGLMEEKVAQELQTLEDNGLVDVKYPAFGEPIILYKEPVAR
ncbi:MAG: hypothetical protein Q8P05_02915 [Candidatus Diapherotrites archaeon]|nr:hypothetical protein [Candidatus Diapherotrites archaeon]MDZ4256729.1 hypothetical protein [archaeon]